MSRLISLGSVLIVGILINGIAFGATIFNCTIGSSAMFSWKSGGLFSKNGLKMDLEKKPKTPGIVTLVVSKKKALLKGNAGQAELVKVSPNSFIEATAVGNIFLWTLIPGSSGIPTFLFQQKAYDLMGPIAVMSTYTCD